MTNHPPSDSAADETALAMGLDLRTLAQRIRSLRQASGQTLEQVAAAAEQTRSWLSKVENGHITPSLPALGRIAQVLGVSLAHLVSGLESCPPLVVVPHDKRVAETSAPGGRKLLRLAMRPPLGRLRSWSWRIPPDGQLEWPAADGEVVAWVQAGQLRLEHAGQAFGLAPGDSVAWDAREATLWRNLGSAEAELVVTLLVDAGGEATARRSGPSSAENPSK